MAEKFDPYHVWLAIPPADQPPNHYRLLGVSLFEQNVEAIEQAADRQMGHLRNHQTGKHVALSQRLLNEVAKARVCLLNPEKKAAYDQQLRQQLDTPGPAVAQEQPVVAVTDHNLTTRHVKHAGNGAASSRWLVFGGIAAAVLVVVGLIAWAMQDPGDRVAQDTQAASQAAASADGASADGAGEESATETNTSDHGGTETAQGSPDRDPGPGEPKVPVSSPIDEGPSTSDDSASADDSADFGLGSPEPQPNAPQPDSPSSANADGPTSSDPPGDDVPETDAEEQASEPSPPGQTQFDRHPVPPGSVQKTILAQVDQAFNVGEAQQPAEKLELAGRLAALAEKSQKPEERFVLLRRAADLACGGGDAALMLDLVERIAEQYEVDLLHAQQVMLLRFADTASGKEQIAALVEASGSVVEQLVANQRIELADELGTAAYRAALKQDNTDVRKAALARRREVQRLRDSLKQIEEARAALEANPDDAEAHATLGRWHAFELGDWKAGLPHLAKGNDPELSKLAEEELASSQEAMAQVPLGDAWWEAASKSSEDVKPSLLSRAAYWYRQAQPELTSIVVKARSPSGWRRSRCLAWKPPHRSPRPRLLLSPRSMRSRPRPTSFVGPSISTCPWSGRTRSA